MEKVYGTGSAHIPCISARVSCTKYVRHTAYLCFIVPLDVISSGASTAPRVSQAGNLARLSSAALRAPADSRRPARELVFGFSVSPSRPPAEVEEPARERPSSFAFRFVSFARSPRHPHPRPRRSQRARKISDSRVCCGRRRHRRATIVVAAAAATAEQRRTREVVNGAGSSRCDRRRVRSVAVSASAVFVCVCVCVCVHRGSLLLRARAPPAAFGVKPRPILTPFAAFRGALRDVSRRSVRVWWRVRVRTCAPVLVYVFIEARRERCEKNFLRFLRVPE